MLKKWIGDPLSILFLEGLEVDTQLCSDKVSVEIVDRQVMKFRNKYIASVKILWKNHILKSVTWEVENNMCPDNLTLFLPLLFNVDVRIPSYFLFMKGHKYF